MPLKLNIAGIVGDSIVDGPGIRTTVFVQGCPHHCPGCHNPDTWEFGKGTKMTTDEVLAEIKKNPICRGVTFSGGEPFCQAGALAELSAVLKDEGYETASYTGYTFEELIEGTEEQRRFLQTLDVLVDGPFVLAKRNLDLRFRGSSNQRILDIPESLAAGKAVWYAGERWVGSAVR